MKKPIVVLTGFLGSGKTTLIRRLLTESTALKFAVIMNEFSEEQHGVERSLLVARSGEAVGSYIEMPNGCMCCSAQNEFFRAVQALLDREKETAESFDFFMVEANGLAEVSNVR